MVFSKKYFLLLIFNLSFSIFVKAQSANFIHPQPMWNENVAAIKMQKIPLAQLEYEDELNRNNKNIPWRFAYTFDVNLSPENAGSWQTLDNGTKIWQLKITSTDAQSLHFVFEKFNLPKDAYLIIYNNENHSFINVYNAANINSEHILGTTLITGDEAVIEYVEPANAAFKGTFILTKIFHGYRTLGYKSTLGFGNSGSCETNINCPVGENWQKEKRAVVVLVAGAAFCSGSLLNDVPQDTIPFLMTAHHCGTTGTSSWVIVFNYESPNCCNVNVAMNQTVNGATLLATNQESDFSLFRLNSKVPLSFHPFFAGWNRSNALPDSVVCIHHPEGDIKKISFANSQCYDSSYTDQYTAKCWNVRHWDGTGVTEPGSSGSPLYNKYHQFVGQLYGGPSYCGCNDTDKNDYFGKFSVSWNYDTAIHAQAKYWLDPQNTGAISIVGFDPNPLPNVVLVDCPTGIENNSSNENGLTEQLVVYPNPCGDELRIMNYELITGKIEVTDLLGRIVLNPIIHNSSFITHNLPSGIYFLKAIDDKGFVHTVKFVKE